PRGCGWSWVALSIWSGADGGRGWPRFRKGSAADAATGFGESRDLVLIALRQILTRFLHAPNRTKYPNCVPQWSPSMTEGQWHSLRSSSSQDVPLSRGTQVSVRPETGLDPVPRGDPCGSGHDDPAGPVAAARLRV